MMFGLMCELMDVVYLVEVGKYFVGCFVVGYYVYFGVGEMLF